MSAMQSKYDVIMKTGTWSLCAFPPCKKAIGTKRANKLKRKPDGTVDRLKIGTWSLGDLPPGKKAIGTKWDIS